MCKLLFRTLPNNQKNKLALELPVVLKLTLLVVLVGQLIGFVNPDPVYAAWGCEGRTTCDTSQGYMNLDCIELVYCNVYNSMFALAGVAVFIYLCYGGFLFLTAAGNPDQISLAGKTLTYAVLGLAMVAVSYVALRFLQNVVGGIGGTVDFFKFSITGT